jgi:hypothetical protein
MSTKTLRKRIALVAVSALGFGLVSSVPAMAAYPATSSLTLGWSSVTVVDADTTNNNGFFYADTNNMAAASSTSTTRARLVAGETIAVTVTAAPTGRSVTDLNINSVTNAASAINTAFVDAQNATANDEDILITGAADNTHGNSNNTTSSTTVTGNELNRYWFAVNTDTTAAIGAGEYTLRVRLTNAELEVKDYTVKVKFVAAIADAGAVLTLANTGAITTAASGTTPYARTANTSTTATLRDANGGRVQIGQPLTGNRTGWDPALTADIVNSSGVSVESLTIADSGVTAVDHVACGTGGAAACSTASAGTSAENQVLNAAINAAADAVYGVTDSDIDADPSSTTSVRVRISNTSVSASIAVQVITATTAVLTGTQVRLAATGIAAADTEFRDITVTSGAGTITYALPLAATTAKFTVDAGTTTTAGQALTATTTWSGNFATANVTPASANVQTVFTDASGRVVIDLTNSSPVAGAVATVKITGFATATESLTITSTWAAATVDSLTILDPASGIYAKTKSATVFSVEADDQFGNPIAGVQITPSLSSTSANYSATANYAPVTTGANGIATWTLTDAAATDILGDTITFTSVVNGKTAQYSLTYKATLPVVSSMTGFRSDALQNVAETVALRGTSISSSAGVTGTLNIARDLSKSLEAFADVTASGDDMYAVRIRAVTSTGAAATGAPVTLTASTGAWVQDVSGLPATSRTVAANADGDAYFRILATATGTLTFTATSGTSSFAFPMTIADQSNAAARFVTLTGATTGTANGAGVPMTATVTDRYGNGVANVTLTVTASGVGAFMGGATSQSFTTDATGRYTFLATSYTAAGGAATYSVTATNATDASSLAGFSSTTAIDSTVKAGNKAATATITYAAGDNASEAAAQAASDAAAEATDAANAATDAANAAAEAADAATAAAQDAADAVAALSTQVSEMVDALKKQITALTNLVIKIQKKVRA